MLELMNPVGWKDKTEQEVLQAIHEHNKERPSKTVTMLLEFIQAFREAHKTKSQKILYSFDEDKFGSLGFVTHRVYFYDANYPDRNPIGLMEREFIGCEGRCEGKYGIYHRFNGHKRRAPRNARLGLVADTTKDLKRAVSIAVKQFKPLTDVDVAIRTSEKAAKSLGAWARETYKYDPILNREELVEEMQNLVEQGVIFKTKLYKEAAGELSDMTEYYRRQAVRDIPMVFVVEHNGVVSTGRSEGGGDCRLVSKFNDPQDMPESLYAKYSLLRLTEEETHMPEVGYRDVGGVCWLFGVTSDEFEKVFEPTSDC
jgi:hypothetical protein